jgi:hypothetical protein
MIFEIQSHAQKPFWRSKKELEFKALVKFCDPSLKAPFVEVLAELQAAYEAIPPELRETAQFEVCQYDDGPGLHYPMIVVSYSRPPTDAELVERDKRMGFH